MKIERRFTTEESGAYGAVDFTMTTSEIRNPDGKIVFRNDQVEVPKGWSQVASDVIAQKYFRKAGVPLLLKRVREKGVPDFLWRSVADTDALEALPESQRYGGETSARQVFDRLAGAWAYWGWKGGYFSNEEDARAYYDEMRFMLARQMAAPNSPQWFNTGLHWAYGIDGPSQGHFYVDFRTGKLVKSASAYEHPQPHACFIQSVGDDLVNEGGIMDLWVREARLFKYGSGTGTNFSSLRGEGESLSGGGRSSGLMGFLKIGDRAAGAIKSGGTTRRAAKMVICDMDHPDIEAFINWKVIEEQKVASLVAGSKAHEAKLNDIFAAIGAWDGSIEDATDPAVNDGLKAAIRGAKKAMIPETYINRVLQYARQGFDSIEFPTYDTDWDSEAYVSVSGQNSNNSVRVTDAFLNAVRDDRPWELLRRTDGKVARTVSARELWDQVGHAAWACADPGIQFHDTVNAWHTCPEDGAIRVDCTLDPEGARVRVTDDGRGIDPSFLPKIFDLFAQARDGGHGLGLGLSLVKRLVDMHGGTVSASSEGEGKGSTFEILIPVRSTLRDTGALSSDSIKAAAPPATLPGADLTLQIQLIDDEDDIRQTMAMLLQSWGHHVTEDSDPEAAIEHVVKNKPDVVIVDLGMPTMGGLTVARTLTERCGADRPTLIALTGYGSDKDRARTKEAGFDAHMVKPVEPAELQTKLRELAKARLSG